MKTILESIKKNFAKFQDTLLAEGDSLIRDIKVAAAKETLDEKKKAVGKIIEKKLKKVEPAFERLVKDVRLNAKKAGIDGSTLERFEKNVASAADTAADYLKDIARRLEGGSDKKTKRPIRRTKSAPAKAKPKAKKG
jgi:hypothetical protein